MCVCLRVSVCVCVYITIHLFYPVKLKELRAPNVGTQGPLFWAQLRKLCFVPLHVLVFDLKLKISQPLPPIQKQINTEGKKALSSQHIGPPQPKNEGGWKSSDEPVWTTDSKKIPVLVEEFKNTVEIIRQYRISWLTRAILFISKQYQPSSSVPTTEELQEQEDSN